MVSCDDINPNVYKLYNYFSSIVFPFNNLEFQNSSILKLGQKWQGSLSIPKMFVALLFSKFVLTLTFLGVIIGLNFYWGLNKEPGFYTPDKKRLMVVFNGIILIPLLCCLLFVLSLADMSFTFSIILRIICVGLIIVNIISLNFLHKDSGNSTKKKFIDKVNYMNAIFFIVFLIFHILTVIMSGLNVGKTIKEIYIKFRTLLDVIYCHLKTVVTSNS